MNYKKEWSIFAREALSKKQYVKYFFKRNNNIRAKFELPRKIAIPGDTLYLGH